jgi:hypothetical protein
MLGKNLVTSLAILITLTAPVQGVAQECRYIPREEGSEQMLDRHIMVNGEVFFYLPVEEAKDLQKKAEDYPLVVRENKLLKKENETLESITAVQGSTITRLEGESEFTHEFVQNAWKPPQKAWYENEEVTFIAGIVFASVMYMGWSYADNKFEK